MPFIEINQVHYFFERSGNGVPLVLLHGFTGSSPSWQAQTATSTLLSASVLSRHFSTITIDLLGHGRTASPTHPDRYRMEQAAADIIAVLERQKAEGRRQKVHLVGYSMGGRLALYLAVTYPDWFASLVLESASPGLATEIARAERQKSDEALADWIETNGIEAFVDRWEQLPLWANQAQMPPAERQKLRHQRLQNNPVGLANSLRGMGTGVQPSLWPHLADLTLPVLLLAGELDHKFVSINQQMAAQIPHCQLEIIPQAGHTVHWERPYQFNTNLLNFYQQL